MEHVVRKPTAPFPALGGALMVHQIPSMADNLVWLVVCQATGDAAVIDGPEAGTVLDYCEQQAIRLTAVLNTHTHWDHIGINKDLEKRGLLQGLRVVGGRSVAADVPGLTQGVDEGDEVRVGEAIGRVMRTEGHLDGHVSYVFGDVVFCGDTLFAGGCGYLFDGPPQTMFDSLMRLAGLPPETRVCCAHEYTEDNLRFAWSMEPGNAALAARIREVWAIRADGGCTVPSTIEVERATNPFLRPGSPELMSAVGQAMPEAELSTPAAVFAATRELKDSKRYRTDAASQESLEAILAASDQ